MVNRYKNFPILLFFLHFKKSWSSGGFWLVIFKHVAFLFTHTPIPQFKRFIIISVLLLAMIIFFTLFLKSLHELFMKLLILILILSIIRFLFRLNKIFLAINYYLLVAIYLLLLGNFLQIFKGYNFISVQNNFLLDVV